MTMRGMIVAAVMLLGVTVQASAQSPDRATTMDVLDKYGALLANTNKNVVRNVSELPYPKATIKQVLLAQLLVVNDQKLRDALEVSYISLAGFQEMTAEEDTAARKWDELMRSGRANTDTKQLAGQIVDLDKTYRPVFDRFIAEQAKLYGELKKFEDEHKLTK